MHKCFGDYKKYCFYFLFFIITLVTFNSYAYSDGLTLHSTRVIFPEVKQKGVIYSISNNTDELYLLQAQIKELSTDNTMGNISSKLIVVPPLQRFEPKQKISLRLLLVDNTSLPKNRESVFLLILKAIPNNQDISQNDSTLQLAVQNNIKIFYRPIDIPDMTTAEINEKLVLSLENGHILVDNPTPYYITFESIKVGDESLNNDKLSEMIPPFSKHSYIAPNNSVGKISWSILNDYGEPIKK